MKVTGVEVDFPQVIAHKNDISKKLTGGVRSLLKMNKVTVIDGKAAFTAPKKLSVKKADGSHEEMTADAIIISTGSVNSTPPIPGLKENPNCIDSTGALSLKVLPKSWWSSAAASSALSWPAPMPPSVPRSPWWRPWITCCPCWTATSPKSA